MKRRVILIVSIVAVLGLIVAGGWYFVHRNQGPKLLIRAQINLNNRQFDRALDLARQYEAKYPDDWRGYLAEGQAQIGRAAYDEARAALEKARGLNASDAAVAIVLSRTYSLPMERALSSDNAIALDGAAAALGRANAILDAWSASAAQGSAPKKSAVLDVKQEKGMNLAKEGVVRRRKADLCEKEAEAQRTVGNADGAAEKVKESVTLRTEAEKTEREALSC